MIAPHALGGFPILSLTLFIPLAGALLIIFFFRREQVQAIKWVAFVVTLIDFLVGLPILFAFDSSTHQLQFVEKARWIEAIGVEYFLGVDGISLLLVFLTTLLGAIAVVCSFSAIEERQKEYYFSLLFLQTGMLGVFMAMDFFLFYVFWEVMLVPMYFLIGIWGGPRKLYAAIKFFLYTLFGSVVMLLAILALYFLHYAQTGVFTFSFLELLKRGTFRCVVVEPKASFKGLLVKRGRLWAYLTADEHRLPLLVRATTPWGPMSAVLDDASIPPTVQRRAK